MRLKNIIRRFIQLLLILAGSSSPAFALTYYVDYSGGADSNAGTSTAAPWKHCPGDPNATSLASATTPASGSTIKFKGGVVYSGGIVLKNSGSTLAKNQYLGNVDGLWGTGRAILDGSSTVNAAFDLSTHPDYQHIEGFEIRNFAGRGINGDTVAGVKSCELVNNVIHDIGTGATNDFQHGPGVYLTGASNFVLDGGEIYRTDYIGIDLSGTSAAPTIKNVYLHDGKREAIVFSATGNALIDNIRMERFDYQLGGIHPDGLHILGYDGGITVTNSVAVDCLQAFFFEQVATPQGAHSAGQITVSNCLIFQHSTNNGWTGDSQGIVVDHGYNPGAGISIDHCTFVYQNQGAGGVHNEDRCCSVNFPSEYTLTSVSVTNCVFYEAINGLYLTNPDTGYPLIGTLALSGNLYYNASRGWYLPGFKNLDDFRTLHPGLESGSHEGGANFASLSSYDFRILSGTGLGIGWNPVADVPTPSVTPSVTPSRTPSPTPTASPTRTPTPTPSPSPTASATPTPTPSVSATPENTQTPTPSPSVSASPSPSATPTPSPTAQSQVSAPTISPSPRYFFIRLQVSISDATSGGAIHYTTDGTTPTASSPTYAGAFYVYKSCAVKAIAVKAGLSDSPVSSTLFFGWVFGL